MPSSETPLKWRFIEMVFRWRANDGPTLNTGYGGFVIFQGIWTSIAKEPYSFVIFQGGPDPLSSPLDPPTRQTCQTNEMSKLIDNRISFFFWVQ